MGGSQERAHDITIAENGSAPSPKDMLRRLVWHANRIPRLPQPQQRLDNYKEIRRLSEILSGLPPGQLRSLSHDFHMMLPPDVGGVRIAYQALIVFGAVNGIDPEKIETGLGVIPASFNPRPSERKLP